MPARYEELVKRAEFAVDCGDRQTAVECFEAACEERPNTYVYVRLGALYRRDGRLDAARSAYLRGFEVEADEPRRNPAIRTGLAFVGLEDRWPAAHIVPLLEQATELGEDAATFRIAARAFRQLARRDGREEFLRSAERLDRKAEELHRPVVEAERQVARFERVVQSCTSEIRRVLSDAKPERAHVPVVTGTATAGARVRYSPGAAASWRSV